MKKRLTLSQLLAYLVLLATIIFNLWLYFPETTIVSDPNDNIFQYSLVLRTQWVWEQYQCPLSLSCLPNLLDHVVPMWAEGYPLPVYYSHVPQILTVATYKLLVEPVSLALGSALTLHTYYNWTKYLLLSIFPLSVFLALRILRFSPISSSLAAFFAAHISTDGLYGIDPPSFLWRGYGLTSQLYAMVFMPLAIAFAYRAISSISESRSLKSLRLLKEKDSLFAILFLTLTMAGHLGLGIIAFLLISPFILIDFTVPNIIRRSIKLLTIVFVTIGLLSYWIIPILLTNDYHLISFWDPIWKFDSYGWYEVVRQFFQGEVFDWQRYPIITALVFIGYFVSLTRKSLRTFSFMFTLSVLLYFGRSTWGSLIDLVPGLKDFHQHRFIVAIHFSSLFLIAEALSWIFQTTRNLGYHLIIHLPKSLTGDTGGIRQLADDSPSTTLKINVLELQPSRLALSEQSEKGPVALRQIHLITITIACLLVLFYTLQQTYRYGTNNTMWLRGANEAYQKDAADYSRLIEKLSTLPAGRVYAGRPGNWGKDLRVGSTQLYMALGVSGFDVSQFLPETWSPMSENDQNFDERVAEDYDLLNIQYIVSDRSHDFPSATRLIDTFGKFQLYEITTSGWFSVVTSPMLVTSSKTDFINIVHYWHRGYTRRWGMHPLLSLQKDSETPFEVSSRIHMADEVSYEKNAQTYNIFADFPFVFPQATASGTIKQETVQIQSYRATIDVPDPCPSCMAMFKMSYHPNWKVTVDGTPRNVYATFPFYLATPVTPGTHIVEFSYRAGSMKTFLFFLSCLGVVGYILYTVKTDKKTRKDKAIDQ